VYNVLLKTETAFAVNVRATIAVYYLFWQNTVCIHALPLLVKLQYFGGFLLL